MTVVFRGDTVVIRGEPIIHPVLAARDFCLAMSPGNVDVESFERVAKAIDASNVEGYVLGRVDDLRKLCESMNFLVVSDSDCRLRAFLPGEWPVPSPTTIEEAKRILEEARDSYNSPYVSFGTHGDGATIDGFFTLQQLEALLVIAREELKEAQVTAV